MIKTKNILKIGVFSIVILSLLISPILKSITPEANAFFLWTSAGTSTTGLNFEDYLSTCTSSAVNNTIANNPTAYTVLCCNDKDHNLAVRNSSSYSTIVSNCETAQENASAQGVPPFDEGWCTDALKYGPLSQSDKAIAYIEKCCNPEEGKIQYILYRCQEAYDTINTDLQEEAVIEEETDIKNCVVKEYDENDPAIKLLYTDNQLYIDKCCNLAPDKVNSLSTSDQALLAQRCEWAKDENIDLFTGESKDQINPVVIPPGYYGPNITQEQYEDIQEYINDLNADEICANVGKWSIGWPEMNFEPLYLRLTCIIQKGTIEGLGKMFAGIMNLEINMILWAFKPSTYGGFVNNPAVQGTTDNPGVWNFMRNLVNLVLVLALVVIAIASILGIKKYSWQNTLWKLVIVALLVNFSLVMAGMILDTSNFLSYYFLNLAKVENQSISESISSSFDVEGISSADKYELPSVYGQTASTTVGWSMKWGQFLLVAFAIILIGLFAVIALLAIFLAMIVRSFIMIVLLCLSPAAFAAWILPDTEKYWKMWWEQFIKWCTFPIIFGLMFYIGVFAVNHLGIENEKGVGMMAFIIQIMLFSMFLVGGLIFSIQGGGAAAQFAIKQTGKVGSAVGGFLGYKALKGVTGSETWRKVQKRLEGSKFAPIHDTGVWMSRQHGKIRAAELKQIEEDYKKRNEDQIRLDMKIHKDDRVRVAAGLNELIERKKINYEKDSESVDIARNQPSLNVPGLKKVHPELYVEYFTKPEDMEKAIKQAQSKAPHIISRDEAKKRALIDLAAKRVKESDPEAIKSGNWDNILERLEKKGISENKGTQYTDHFFNSLWDANVPPEGFAAMLRLMKTEKQKKWAQEFVESVKRRVKGDEAVAIAELKKKRFDKNRFMNELLPF